MKISRLVVSAVSLAVSAAMLTLSIIDLIRNDEYCFLHENGEAGVPVNSDSEKKTWREKHSTCMVFFRHKFYL